MMNMLTHLPRTIQRIGIFYHQSRFYARPAFANKLTHYLRRAELIDSIRLCLRVNDRPHSLLSTLNTRLLDSFVVTHALRSAPNAESALLLVDSLKSVLHFSHNHSTVHALATVLAKSKRQLELRILIDEINLGRFGDVRVSFMDVMCWFSTAEDFEAVLDTWERYHGSSDKGLCAESYNVVMRMFARMGKDYDAVGIFCKMIDGGVIPNSRTYTVMIEHLVGLGKLDSAIEVFRMLPFMRVQRTLKQYSVLVDAFVAVERFDVVKTLLDEMKVDGKFPGRAMHLALQCLQKAGFMEETEEWLSEMLPDERIKSIGSNNDSSDEDNEDDDNEGVNDGDGEAEEVGVRLKQWLDPKALANALNQWSPDVVSVLEDVKFVWTTRLVCKVLRNFRSSDTAWDFFCWVAYQPGFTHDIHTVQKMIEILARRGKAGLVDKLISKVRSEGMRLPFSTIKLIIEFYGVSKNADAALKVFREDRELSGPITKAKQMLLYSSLLRTLTKCKRNSDAIDILEEMVSYGIIPDIQTFSGLMYHFALQGEIKTVQKLFSMVRQTGLQPDAYTFKMLIEAYCKSERAALAYRVFEDMKNLNMLPDAATKDLLIKSLWKEGKRKESAIVEESCEEMACVLPLALRGKIWTASSSDLTRVYNIYSDSLQASNMASAEVGR